MTMTSGARAFLIASLLAGGAATSANATSYIDTSLSAVPTGSGFVLTDLSTLTAPDSSMLYFDNGSVVAPSGPYDETISFSVAAGQGVVQGSSGGQYAAPYTPTGPYAGNYFSTGAGSITITYSSEQLALALLWGSVDADNSLQLFNNGSLVDTISGSQIQADANGNQGFGGSFYTLINSTVSFDQVVLSSTSPSFEFAQFEASESPDYIPEPASLAVFAAGLLGLAMARQVTVKAKLSR